MTLRTSDDIFIDSIQRHAWQTLPDWGIPRRTTLARLLVINRIQGDFPTELQDTDLMCF